MRNSRQRRNVSVVLAALAILGISAACGKASGADSNSLGWQELQNLSAFERGVLSDKLVDTAELDRATQVYIECLKSAGITAMQHDPDRPGPNGVQTQFTAANDDEANRKNKSTDTCYAEVNAVQDVWTLQHQASEQERQAAMVAFGDCTRAAGLDIAPDTAFRDAVSAAQEAVQRNRGAQPTGAPAAVKTTGPDVAAVKACLETVTLALESAPPGLQEALDDLHI